MSRSGKTRVATVGRNNVGPVTRERTCEHGGVLFPSDPGVRHVTPCDQKAVVDVPVPHESIMGHRAFCPFHFARYLATWSEEIEADLRECFDVDEHLPPAYAFVELDDVPEEIKIERRLFVRVGLDQAGAAHFSSERESTVVVAEPTEDDLDYTIHSPPGEVLARWLTHVRERRGWAEFNPRVTPAEVS